MTLLPLTLEPQADTQRQRSQDLDEIFYRACDQPPGIGEPLSICPPDYLADDIITISTPIVLIDTSKPSKTKIYRQWCSLNMQAAYRFSPLDEIIPPLYNAFIFGFPCPNSEHEKMVKTLDEGWRRTLEERPSLAGEIEFDRSEGVRPGTLKLKLLEHCLHESVAVNDMTRPGTVWKDSYATLRAQDMPSSKLDGEVLAPLVSGVSSTSKVASVQINLIPGGCLLALCTSHSFVDARGCLITAELWAKHCRELQSLPAPPFDGLSCHMEEYNIHSLIHKKGNNAEYNNLKHRPELWHLLGLHAIENLESGAITAGTKDFSHIPAASPLLIDRNIRSCIFSFSSFAMESLKQEASPKGPAWVSSGDTLIALLWRSIMLARFPFPDRNLEEAPDTRKSTVSVAVNGRKIIQPPLPVSYTGNVVFCCMTTLPMDTVLSPPTSLSDLALQIRKNVEITKEKRILEEAISLAACIPDVSSLKIAFNDFFGADLTTTSWVDLPFYDLDFGPIFGKTGRMEFFRMPRGQFGGICSLQPRRTDGSVEVVICLATEQMTRLRENEHFAQYAQIVSE